MNIPAPVFRSSARLAAEATDALVLMCSDRRYREPAEEFLNRHLGLASYDLVAVPGGAYVIAFADALPKQVKLGMRMLRFLARNHSPSRIVLIAHQDCGRYREGFASWLRRPGFSLEEKQLQDLAVATRDLREAFPGRRVEAYFARPAGDGAVQFEAVTP